jgi:hypothetical protein
VQLPLEGPHTIEVMSFAYQVDKGGLGTRLAKSSPHDVTRGQI